MGILGVTTPAPKSSSVSSHLRDRGLPIGLSAAGSDETIDDNEDDDVKKQYTFDNSTTTSTTSSYEACSTPRMLAADTPTSLLSSIRRREGGSSLDVGCGVSPCAAKAMEDMKKEKNGSSTTSRVRFSFSSSSDKEDDNKQQYRNGTSTKRTIIPSSKPTSGPSQLRRWPVPSSTAMAPSILCLVMILAIGVVHVLHSRSYQLLAQELEDVVQSRDVHQRNLIKARKAADELATFNDHTHKQVLDLKDTQQHIMEQLTMLKHRIAMDSQQHVLKKYGKGPHRVLFKLSLPTPNNEFILELAPLDRMPHTNQVFLDGVDNKIWNGKAAFWINAGHIVQAGSKAFVNADATDDEAVSQQQTTDANYEQYSVSFREYIIDGKEYNHEAWTAGFAGNPGGPDFYINKRSNVEHHGPNTQSHHKLDGDADPCFAKVVSGFDTLRVIDSSKTKEGSSIMEQPIQIIEAKII